MSKDVKYPLVSRAAKERWKDPEYQFKMGMIHNNPNFTEDSSIRRKKLWEDPKYRKHISKVNKNFWRDNAKARIELGEKLKKVWKNSDSRKEDQSKRMSDTMKSLWKSKKYRIKHTRVMNILWDDCVYKRRMKSLRKDPKYLKYMSAVASNNWKDPEYQKKIRLALNRRPNKAELQLYNILQEIIPGDYQYVGNFKFFVGGKNPDFRNVNGQKKLIELYGKHWHDPRKFPNSQSPEQRIRYFKKYGYKTLIVWEHELKDKEKLVNKLYEFDYD
jgi:hypothetical protein